MADIKFWCPKCSRRMVADESVKSEVVTCPDCQEQFFPLLPPAPKLPPPPAPAIAPAPEPSPLNLAAEAAQAERDRLKSLAAQSSSLHSIGDALTGLGAVFGILGLLIALALSANNSPGGLAAAAAGVGCAITVVVVGQLFHIRASVLHLEK